MEIIDNPIPDSLVKEWLHHPCTKGFIKNVERDRQSILEQWASGSFTDTTSHGTAQLNAKAIGQVMVLDDLLDYFKHMHEQEDIE